MAPAKAKVNVKSSKKPGKKPSNKQETGQRGEPATSIPLELQQLLLNIFKHSFSERFETDIKPLLQEVKGHLYNRDFTTAFGKEEYLEAYAARWSPSRALGYADIFERISEEIQPPSRGPDPPEPSKWKVACLGGGAGAESVALGGFWKRLQTQPKKKQLNIVAIDIAAWSKVVEKLRHHLVNSPPLSKYASAAAQAANTPMLDGECLDVVFHQYDLLNAPISALGPLVQDANLVTLMFTLNELYSASLSLTQQFLFNLTSCLGPRAFLLVVDSPGSYSSVSLNGAEKKYPMHWLLDHTLLGETRGEKPLWEKVKEEESMWFRLDERLRYPIDLENMRYQLHLYRRLG